MKVAVLCPTRGRPDTCSRMVRSVVDTSSAHVLVYYDEDDTASEEIAHWASPRITAHRGPRIGPVAAANLLVELHHDYDAYGLVTDDSILTIPGWDDWLLESIERFPNRIAIVSPFHNHGNHVDMPFVSKEWIEVTGWFACPEMFHYSWPTVTGLIGEMTGICHAPLGSFAIEHDYVDGTYPERRSRDNDAFYNYVSLKLPDVVERLRKAMYPERA